jgi:4-hydroxy-L-threonine phosphate dehydrogenase PdxA
MGLPRIAIATGDPAGIGPEIALKAALDPRVTGVCWSAIRLPLKSTRRRRACRRSCA